MTLPRRPPLPRAVHDAWLRAMLREHARERGAVGSAETLSLSVLPPVRGIEHTSEEFRAAVESMAARLHISPLSLYLIMAFETGGSFDPARRNPVSGATGLIGFMPHTASGLGVTLPELAAMSAVEQLRYVELYLQGYHALNTLEDAYMAVLWPSAIGKGRDFTLWCNGIEYVQNRGLDVNSDGCITVGEATDQVRAMTRTAPPESHRPIFLLGDSFAQGLGPAMVPLFAKLRTPFAYCGIPSTTITYWTSGSRLAHVLEDAHPVCTLVSLGANDARNGHETASRASDLIAALREHGSSVVWILPPAMPSNIDTLFRYDLAHILTLEKVPFFDSATLSIPREPGDIHPTASGYDVWARAILAWMTEPKASGGGGEVLSYVIPALVTILVLMRAAQ